MSATAARKSVACAQPAKSAVAVTHEARRVRRGSASVVSGILIGCRGSSRDGARLERLIAPDRHSSDRAAETIMPRRMGPAILVHNPGLLRAACAARQEPWLRGKGYMDGLVRSQADRRDLPPCLRRRNCTASWRLPPRPVIRHSAGLLICLNRRTTGRAAKAGIPNAHYDPQATRCFSLFLSDVSASTHLRLFGIVTA